jgi:hypothetical protein
MKSKVTIVTLILTLSANAFAQDKFGLGLILGEPTGLSLKYWFDTERAIDGAVAWSYSENDSLQLHADYLIHNYDVFDTKELPFYCGLGARLKFKEDDGRGRNEHHDIFGIRIPLGVTYVFDEAPVDLFFEIVPVLDLAPDIELDLNAAVGLRIYF